MALKEAEKRSSGSKSQPPDTSPNTSSGLSSKGMGAMQGLE